MIAQFVASYAPFLWVFRRQISEVLRLVYSDRVIEYQVIHLNKGYVTIHLRRDDIAIGTQFKSFMSTGEVIRSGVVMAKFKKKRQGIFDLEYQDRVFQLYCSPTWSSIFCPELGGKCVNIFKEYSLEKEAESLDPDLVAIICHFVRSRWLFN